LSKSEKPNKGSSWSQSLQSNENGAETSKLLQHLGTGDLRMLDRVATQGFKRAAGQQLPLVAEDAGYRWMAGFATRFSRDAFHAGAPSIRRRLSSQSSTADTGEPILTGEGLQRAISSTGRQSGTASMLLMQETASMLRTKVRDRGHLLEGVQSFKANAHNGSKPNRMPAWMSSMPSNGLGIDGNTSVTWKDQFVA